MIPPPDAALVARFRDDVYQMLGAPLLLRHSPTFVRHPSESWGLSSQAPCPVEGDPSFRWGDDLGEGDLAGGYPERSGDDAAQVALAVSGGPDSLALLLLAHAAFPGRVTAATVDHRIRPEAAAEAAAVAAICAMLGVPHAVLPVTVARAASIQAAARGARYAALEGWAVAAGAGALFTAHHLDDQAETILMRVARGAGIAGLAGIRPIRPLGRVTLARPLLGWRKDELVTIVAAAGLVPVDDPANRDPRFDRARARRLLAAEPWLAPARLATFAPLAGQADAALDWATAQAAAVRLGTDGDGGVHLDGAGVPREIARRLLLRAILLADPDARPPRGPALDRLLTALEAGKVATLGRLRFAPGPPWRIRRTRPHRSN